MPRDLPFVAAVASLVLVVSSASGLAAAEPPATVAVTNFPALQAISGSVTVETPIPQTRLQTFRALVTPANPSEAADMTEVGVLDATGFAFVTFSLAVTVQGHVTAVGAVGALLIPEQPEILATFHDAGVAEFPLAVEARVEPAETVVSQSHPTSARLAFPRYRVFLYNTTARSSQVVLYAYLGNS